MNESGGVGTATIRAGWVVARQHRMAYDPDLVCGAACLDAEFDHGTRQWVATVRRAPLDGPASVARHLYADAGPGVGAVVDSVRLDLHRTSRAPVHLVEVPYQDASTLVDSGCLDVPPSWARGMGPVNTRVDYLYRDAGNFKTWNSVVVSGVLSNTDVTRCLDACEPGPDSMLFVPCQVGLPEDRGGYTIDASMDVPFFEIGEASFALTVAEPTILLNAPDLVARFDRQRGAWDAIGAEARLFGLDERDVPLR